MPLLIAERRFNIEATPAKIWDLLGRAIFDSLQGLTKMKVIDENNFSAELKIKVFGVLPLTMYLRGEMVDISPPDNLSVRLATRSKGNIITMVQMISFTSKSASKDNVVILCRALAERLSPIIQWAALKQVKSQAGEIFLLVEERLKQWV